MKWLMLISLVLLAACQTTPPAADIVPPTLIDLNAIATGDAATATAAAPPPLPTLPPTWTPTPPAVLEPTASQVAVTPTSSSGEGTLFFIYNGDSIARLAPDGSREELIVVGGAPADLTAAPDGSLLAYTAQGSGSAREVFVSSPDGTYVQAVSCLGFARVLKPAWSFDSRTLAFAASQTADGPLGLYTANVVGSGQCPGGNNQRQVAQLEANQLTGLAWSPAGTWLFASHGAISAFNVVDGTAYPDLLAATGSGPNLSPVHSPTDDLLTYLKSDYNSRTGAIGGTLYTIRTGNLQPPVQELRGAQLLARSAAYSRDGRYLLVATEREVWVQDERTGSSLPIVQASSFYPQPVFSPDAEWVAFVDGGRAALTIPQVYIVRRTGANPTPVTAHQEGTISDLTWSAGR